MASTIVMQATYTLVVVPKVSSCWSCIPINETKSVPGQMEVCLKNGLMHVDSMVAIGAHDAIKKPCERTSQSA